MITEKQRISVVGIGRVGLPLALALAEKEFFVHGVDIDKNKVLFVNSGKMPFIEEGADARVTKHMGINIPYPELGKSPNPGAKSICVA